MASGQAVEYGGEILLGMQVVQPCRFNDRIKDGSTFAATIGTEEQEVFACQSDAADEPLGQIVVDAQSPVLDVSGQCIPSAQRILERLAERRLAGDTPALRLGPAMELFQQRFAASLADRPTVLDCLAVDVGLDAIERLDPAQGLFGDRRKIQR